MNKLILYITCIYLFSFTNIKAQHAFSQSSSTYTDLTSYVSINNGTPWYDALFAIPIGFNFKFLGQNYDTLFMGTNGTFYLDTSAKQIRIVPFFANLIDKGTSSSLSPLSYKLEKGISDTILKVEVKDATFGSDANSNVSFQTWIYKNSNTIEFHIGPIVVNDPLNAYGGTTGPMIGLIYNYDTPQDTIKSAFLLSGLPSSAQALHISSNSFSFTNGTPVNGTVYKFMFDPTGIQNHNKIYYVNSFPNPCAGKYTIELIPELYNATLEVINMEGKIILNDNINSSSLTKTVDLSILPDGIYSLRIISKEINTTQKIVLLKNL